MKKSLLPVLVLVCALGGTTRANTTTYDGTYSGSFSGTVVCVGPNGTVIVPVPPAPVAFSLLNGVVGVGTGGVDSHGNFNWIRNPGPVTFIGTIGFTGHASGTWSLGGLPPNCTEGGSWSAQREACSRPTVTTQAATFLTNSSATLRGMVNPNGLTATLRFQYGLTTSYGSVTADQTFGGITSQSFSATIYGLNPSTTYHFRTVAINSCGTTYGSDTTFTTLSATGSPVVLTNPATLIASFSATLNGSLDPHGLTTSVHFQYGPTASYGFTTPIQTHTGNTYLNVSANISGLMASQVCHFRIVATNSAGTTFGGDRTFTTLSPTGLPVVTTNPATFIAGFSAMLNGLLDPHGLTTSVHFQYGTTTNYGLTTAPQGHTGNTYLNVGANISSLSASTIYHFRIVASNSAGTSLGSDRTFTTLSATGPPVVTTNPATNVTTSSATLSGSVDPHGLSTTVYFQYGTTTSYGHATASQTKTGSAYQSVSASVSGLSASATYHFRVVATNSAGTRYGADRTFTTP